jgi:hypothetical protein
MSNENKPKGFFWIVSALLLIILVAYNLYSGLTVRRVGIPGIFELEFGAKGSLRDEVPPPGKVPSTVRPHEVVKKVEMKIEELRRELAINENQQREARSEIERLRSLPEMAPDARGALKQQERWLEELQTTRQQMEHELNRLREQR